MISRVAESCFWTFRYLERVESCARLLGVNRSFILDLNLPQLEHWWPIVVVSGEDDRFLEMHSKKKANDGELVQDFLVWEEGNPVSLLNSTRWARANARSTREVISQEMWEAINGYWQWLTGGPGRRTYRSSRDTFYQRAIETSHLFQGLSHNTMLHEEPFDFMRLGMLLERASQTARTLEVKHHALGPTRGSLESAREAAQWSALLQSCAATEVFLKRFGGVVGAAQVVQFLVLEPLFPRSVLHCIDRAWNFLRRIRPRGRRLIGASSAALLEELLDDLRCRTAESILEEGLPRVLASMIRTTDQVCDALRRDYFDPPARLVPSARRRSNVERRGKGAIA